MDMPAVRNLLDAYWDRRLPVKPESFIEALNYELRFLNPFDHNQNGVSGMAQEEYGRKVVYVNRADHHNRQRFTIAHELGHHILGHTSGGHQHFRDYPAQFSTNAHSPYEVDANRFAAELLMPEEAILALVERAGVADVRHLASIFDVSEAAMYWRLRNLNMC